MKETIETETDDRTVNISKILPSSTASTVAPLVAIAILAIEVSAGLFETIGVLAVVLAVVLVLGHGLDIANRLLKHYYQGEVR